MNEALLRVQAARWLATDRRFVLVRVAEAHGSVPRPAGTRMLVSDDTVLGTIGGGHLEWQAIASARERLRAGRSEPLQQRIALGPTLGQCCGGALVLAFEPFDATALAAWPVPAPRFVLQLYGAGHVGRAIVALLETIDCHVRWIDEREEQFPEIANAPHVERVCVEPVQAEVAAAPAGAYYLVLTHRHDLDLAICEAILSRGDFGFLGLIGSATKRSRFVHRFEQRGLACDLVARIVCPIGLPGITGKEPAVIAVAVVAQLLQHAGTR